MKLIVITQSGPAIDKNGLEKIEKSLNVKFPVGYKLFLTTYNGGKPSPENDTYNVPGTYIDFCTEYAINAPVCVDWFYATSYPEYKGYEIASKFETYLNRISSSVVPIAMDGCGNQICLGIEGERQNKVYFWDHEMELEEREENPFLIASSFELFIESLRSYEDPI